VSKPCTPVVHIKIAGKWMFIPLKMVLIGIDPYPYVSHTQKSLLSSFSGFKLHLSLSGPEMFFTMASARTTSAKVPICPRGRAGSAKITPRENTQGVYSPNRNNGQVIEKVVNILKHLYFISICIYIYIYISADPGRRKGERARE